MSICFSSGNTGRYPVFTPHNDPIRKGYVPLIDEPETPTIEEPPTPTSASKPIPQKFEIPPAPHRPQNNNSAEPDYLTGEPIPKKFTKPPAPHRTKPLATVSSIATTSPDTSASRRPQPEQTALRVHQHVGRTAISDEFKAIINSRILRAILFSALAVGGFFTAAFFLSFTPPGWMIAAVAVGGFAIGILFPLTAVSDGRRRFAVCRDLGFELRAFADLFRDHEKKIQEITWKDKSFTKRLYIGGLPNRLDGLLEYLSKEKGVGAVYSIASSRRRRPVGFFQPCRQTDLTDERHMSYTELDAGRSLFNRENFANLDAAADFVQHHIAAGDPWVKNVYVGSESDTVRRQAVAAFLIKYQGKYAYEACKIAGLGSEHTNSFTQYQAALDPAALGITRWFLTNPDISLSNREY